MQWILISCQLTYLLCFDLFFGTQIDQLMCETLQWTTCGMHKSWILMMNIALLPLLYQKNLSKIGYFSLFAVFCTAVSFVLIMFICFNIYTMNEKEVMKEYGLKITKEDRNYNYWNFSMLPAFCAAMMNIFEGNQQILNLYAEADHPKKFFPLLIILFTILLVFIAVLFGLIGYITFGNTIESVIIYNLPSDDTLSILAKMLFIVTISGSFILLMMPIF